MRNIIPPERIEDAIYFVRGHKVLLDRDLAILYGVLTKNLNLAVRRNISRFPSDFMFQLTKQELQILRLQIETSSWGGRRTLPYAFTEQGVAMLSSVLRSPQAIQVNVTIMRTFVKLRRAVASHSVLAKKLDELERKYDSQFSVVFQALRKLMTESEKPKRRIGFKI